MDLLARLTKAMSLELAFLMVESNVLPVSANEDKPLSEPKIVMNAEELKDVITNAVDDMSIMLGADIDYDQGLL